MTIWLDVEMKIRCTCGHDRESHQHHRSGSDCVECPAGVCNRFRATSRLKRMTAAVVTLSQRRRAVRRPHKSDGQAKRHRYGPSQSSGIRLDSKRAALAALLGDFPDVQPTTLD